MDSTSSADELSLGVSFGHWIPPVSSVTFSLKHDLNENVLIKIYQLDHPLIVQPIAALVMEKAKASLASLRACSWCENGKKLKGTCLENFNVLSNEG